MKRKQHKVRTIYQESLFDHKTDIFDYGIKKLECDHKEYPQCWQKYSL